MQYISSKFSIPKTRNELILRKELYKRLDEIERKKLAVVSAPAGYGKTSLISSWIEYHKNEDYIFRWISLDESDDERYRFWNCFIKCFESISKDISDLNLIDSAGNFNYELFISLLSNFLDEMKIRSLILIIDDFHNIKENSILKEFKALIRYLPEKIHLIIVSREKIKLPLAKYKIDDEVLEIGMEDLSFSVEETAAFLKNKMLMKISDDEIVKVRNNLEGWVAGIQIFMLYNRDRQVNEKIIEEFTGEYTKVFEYFSEEVFEELNEETKEFLIKTSCLETFNVAMCDEILRIDTSYNILEALANKNLFLISLDDKKQWYKYHSLFREFLYKHLSKYGTKFVRDIYNEAAKWYEKNNCYAEAILYYSKAEVYEGIVSIIEIVGFEMLIKGNISMVLNWLKLLPKSYVYDNAMLATYFSWISLLNSDFKKVEEYLSYANRESDFSKWQGADELKQQIWLINVVADYIKGNINKNFEELRNNIKVLKEHKQMYCILTLNLGGAYMAKGDIENGEKWFYETINISKEIESYYTALVAVRSMKTCKLLKGEIRKLENIYGEILDYCQHSLASNSPIMGVLYVGIAETYFKRNDLFSCDEFLHKALKLGEESHINQILYDGYVLMSKVLVYKKEFAKAISFINKAEAITKKDRLFVRVIEPIETTKVNILAAAEAYEYVDIWEKDNNEILEKEINNLNLSLYRTLANIYMKKELLLKSIKALETVILFTKESSLHGVLLESLVKRTIVYYRLSKPEEAYKDLEAAIILAQKTESLQEFADGGQEIIKLLHEIKKCKPDLNIEFLLEDLNVHKLNSGIEVLSEREVEVLDLIEAGYSNSMIAESLYISVGTVKRHLINIYGKLGVHSRTQAVLKGKELEILGK